MMVELAMYGSVGIDAFTACTNLKRVYIGPAAQQVGKDAFRLCESLEALYFAGRTLAQVQAMDTYPFGIEDEGVIKAEF